MNLEAQALRAYCGLPSASWRGSGCHLAHVAGTVADGQLEAFERVLAIAFGGDMAEGDTWASYYEGEPLTVEWRKP